MRYRWGISRAIIRLSFSRNRLTFCITPNDSASTSIRSPLWTRNLPGTSVTPCTYTEHFSITANYKDICRISSLLHSVNLILFTVLLVHLILRISPHHSHHFRSHHLSLPRPSLQTYVWLSRKGFVKSFPPQSLWFLPDCLHGSWTCTELNVSGHWRLFVLVSSFYFFVSSYMC